MFDRVSQMAEELATNASRREFLGQFGSAALAVAVAAGGLLALPGLAQGARRRGPVGMAAAPRHARMPTSEIDVTTRQATGSASSHAAGTTAYAGPETGATDTSAINVGGLRC